MTISKDIKLQQRNAVSRWITEQLEKKGWSVDDLISEINRKQGKTLTRSTIYYWLQEISVPVRSSAETVSVAFGYPKDELFKYYHTDKDWERSRKITTPESVTSSSFSI